MAKAIDEVKRELNPRLYCQTYSAWKSKHKGFFDLVQKALVPVLNAENSQTSSKASADGYYLKIAIIFHQEMYYELRKVHGC